MDGGVKKKICANLKEIMNFFSWWVFVKICALLTRDKKKLNECQTINKTSALSQFIEEYSGMFQWHILILLLDFVKVSSEILKQSRLVSGY